MRFSAFAAFRNGAAAVLSRALSAAVWFALFVLAGACLLVSGVYVMLGTGWTMVVGGFLCLIAASLLLIGMTRAG